MTSNYEDNNRNLSRLDNDSKNNYEADYFELLSAYLDGELEPSERTKVQQWLDEDPEIKQVYLKLLKLHQKMQNSAVPPNNISAEEVSAGVFEQLDRTERQRKRFAWSGGAIAAILLAAITGLIPGTNSTGLRMAKSPPKIATPIMLAVAVNKPAIKIPKAAKAYPQKTITQ